VILDLQERRLLGVEGVAEWSGGGVWSMTSRSQGGREAVRPCLVVGKFCLFNVSNSCSTL
jgi:hypothetical protein